MSTTSFTDNAEDLPNVTLDIKLTQMVEGEIEGTNSVTAGAVVMTILEPGTPGEREALTSIGGGISGQEMVKMIISFKMSLIEAIGFEDYKMIEAMSDDFIEKAKEAGYLDGDE